MPIVMLEAMSYGCPVLSSDIEECAEVWETAREEAGIDICRSFRALDMDDLTRALRELLTDSGRKAMGELAREHVPARYDWERIVDETLAVYRQAIEGSKKDKQP